MQNLFVKISAVVLLFPSSMILFSYVSSAEIQADKKLIVREYDALEIGNEMLQGYFDGTRISNLRLMRFNQGALEPIPFDIMEKDDNGNYILDGVNENVEWKGRTYEIKEEAIRAAGGIRKVRIVLVNNRDKPPGILDGTDQLVFLARDAGQRYPGDFSNVIKALEIQLLDPVNGNKAWVYLLDAEDYPTSPEDYVTYGFEVGEQIEHVKMTGGAEVMFDLRRSAAYRDFVLPTNGGIDIVDSFRADVSFKLKPLWLTWLPRFSINPENSTVPILVGYKDGVFALRVVKNKVDNFLLERHLGEEIKRSELVTVSHYFPNYQYFSGTSRLSPKLKKWMKDLDIVTRTDFNENAAGMWFYNSNNSLKYCLIDGKLDDYEKQLNDDPYQWSMLTGENGGWANILKMLNNKEKTRLHYDDNKEKNIWGSSGYRWMKVEDVDAIQFVSYIFFLPPSAGPEFMQQLVNLVYHPLEVSLGREFY